MSTYLQHSLAALQRTLPDAELEITRLPAVEQIQLALINADFQTGPLPADVMYRVIAHPAYWAFCWGSGLALARWLLSSTAFVANKRIADVGCGCGVGAIAAKLAGASEVIACDNDPDALIVTRARVTIKASGSLSQAITSEAPASFAAIAPTPQPHPTSAIRLFATNAVELSNQRARARPLPQQNAQ